MITTTWIQVTHFFFLSILALQKSHQHLFLIKLWIIHHVIWLCIFIQKMSQFVTLETFHKCFVKWPSSASSSFSSVSSVSSSTLIRWYFQDLLLHSNRKFFKFMLMNDNEFCNASMNSLSMSLDSSMEHMM